MAVITFDIEKNSVSILVEKSDMVSYLEDGMLVIGSGSKYTAGKVFANGECSVCIIRGERS